jgi:hypothetical protein
MRLGHLQRTLRTLVSVEPTEAPVISCYANVEGDRRRCRDALDARARVVRASLDGRKRRDFEEALGRVEAFLGSGLDPDAKGAALFARAGGDPLFLPLQFRVPLPTSLAVQATPSVYHLVELKDTYHRYVVVVLTSKDARVLEVNLGEVTEQFWRERPAEPERVRERWTREHYRRRRSEQADEFVREKIKVVDRLMAQGGHSHLIVAGDPRMTDRLIRALPKHLASKLVEVVSADPRASSGDIVRATLAAFVVHEEQESREMVDELVQELGSDGLADVGTEATLRALRWGQADALVFARGYRSEPGWACVACGAVAIGAPPEACGECGASSVEAADLREAMVRLAERAGCRTEVVNESPALERLGGVGCLLRYRAF